MAAFRTRTGALVGHFALRLDADGAEDVTVLAAEVGGGAVYADVISELDAGASFARKQLGSPRYEAFDVPVGFSMSSRLFDWIASSWGPEPEKSDGAVLALDYALDIKTETAFAGSFITQTTIPALDASSVSAKDVVVRIQPELIDRKAGAGKLSFAAKQKLWRTSRFRLQIAGLDCTKVSRIDAFTVKRAVTEVASGSGGVTLVPGHIEFPNLRITFAQATAKTWTDWHEDFVVAGNNGDDFERTGSLSFLSVNMKKELGRIELGHLGIVRLQAAAGQPSRMTAELYCEQMALVDPQGVT